MEAKSNELKKVARQIFNGWVMETYEPEDRRNMIYEILSCKDDIKGVSIHLMQKTLLEQYRKSLSLAWFKNGMPLTVAIASNQEITDSEIHEMYLVATIDYILSPIYGSNNPFAHDTIEQKMQDEIVWKFVLGMVSTCLNPSFRETMRIRVGEAVKLAVSLGNGLDSIIQMIVKSNDNSMNLQDFRVQQAEFIRIAKLGGITNDLDAFRYFKIILAHLFYKLGMESN